MLNKLKSYYESNKEKIEYVISKLDIAILILYGLFVFEAFLRSTTFEINWHPYYHMSLKVILILLVFSKSMLKFVDNIPLYMLLGFCSVGFLLAYLQGNHGILLELILFTIAFVDVDFDKVITVFTIVLGVSLLIIVLGSQTNILNNLIYSHEQGTKKMAFGIHYTTNFASYILYLCFAWSFIRKSSISFIEISSMYALSYGIHLYCDAKTSTICLLGFSTLILLYKLILAFNPRCVKKCNFIYLSTTIIISLSTLVCAFASIFLSYIYTPDNNILHRLDTLLTNRLRLGNETFQNYNIAFFGQNIEMTGSGGFSFFWLNNTSLGKYGYNFIDSSYISILFRYGLFVFICVMVLFTLTSFVARKHNDYITLVIIAIIAVHSIMEHHLLDFNYNPFMFLLISSYYGKHNSKNKLNKSDITVSKKLLQDDLDVITTSNKEVQA